MQTMHKRNSAFSRLKNCLTLRRCRIIFAVSGILFLISLLFLSYLQPSSAVKPVIAGINRNGTVINSDELRQRYFDDADWTLNANPYCTLRREYGAMRWQSFDVRRATKAYLRANTDIIVITGNYDGYSRVRASFCTWMGHVPQERLLFMTDDLQAAGARELFSFGMWKTDTNSSERERAQRYEQKMAGRVSGWGHPRGWFQAQFRFFNALQRLFNKQKSQQDVCTNDDWFSRWVMILDDDTYVHLDTLVASLQYHSVKQLLESNDYWWAQLAVGSAALFGTASTDLQALKQREQSSREVWQKRCAVFADRSRHWDNELQRKTNVNINDCMGLPGKIADIVMQLSRANGTEFLNELASLVGNDDQRLSLIDLWARTLSNAIYFLDDDLPPDSAYARLWASVEELLKPVWIHAFVLRPTLAPVDVVAGQGNYFNAALFHTLFFREEGTVKDRPAEILYGYERSCVQQFLLRGDCGSDVCFRRCVAALGGDQVRELRFNEFIAVDLIRTNRLLGNRPAFRNHHDRIDKADLEALQQENISWWATGHVKMEFYDALRHYSGQRKNLYSPSPEKVAALYRLAHFRMRLYYEAIYHRDAYSQRTLLQLGAQCRNEIHETEEHRQWIDSVFQSVFLPAINTVTDGKRQFA